LPQLNIGTKNGMKIEKHDKSYIVKLDDGFNWKIWPGDIALTLKSSHASVLKVLDIDVEFCSHALIDKTDGSQVRVIEANKDSPVQQVRQSWLITFEWSLGSLATYRSCPVRLRAKSGHH
jgi:hypothetical protein